jgi:hypothetical protein
MKRIKALMAADRNQGTAAFIWMTSQSEESPQASDSHPA